MVRITRELVRKKSEHNELIINTLEELSLHQEDIEQIEYIHDWCKNLKILLLQSNLISKIENLFKLKKLEYLNLAINCVERIENLEKLESLEKLDLTLNFIGELTSIKTLCNNYNLRHLTLTGNPCTEYNGYRDYVIAILPQLETLDGIEIKLSDKIKAKNFLNENHKIIIQSEAEYKIQRDEQKVRVAQHKCELDEKLKNLSDDEERSKLFWETKSENCPETRYDIAKEHKLSKERNKSKDNNVKELKKSAKLFSESGRPYNINQGKLIFHLRDEREFYELELHVYKFLDTSLIEVDAQPNYLRVTVKGKIFQISLDHEINVSESTSKRSQITGHLVVHMPKLHIDKGEVYVKSKSQKETVINNSNKNDKSNYLKGTVNYKCIVKTENSKMMTTINYDEMEVPALI